MTRSLVCWLGEHFLRRDHRIAVDGYRVLYLSGVATGVSHHHWKIARAGYAKDGSRAVALVNVAVDGHGGANLVIALHAPNGDGHIVDHAKAFAVVCEGVVEPAPDVEGHAISQSVLGRQNRTARRQPEG